MSDSCVTKTTVVSAGVTTTVVEAMDTGGSKLSPNGAGTTLTSKHVKAKSLGEDGKIPVNSQLCHVLYPPLTATKLSFDDKIPPWTPLDVEAQTPILNELEQGVVQAVNLLRRDPRKFCDHLREQLRLFIGKSSWRNGIAVATEEGTDAVMETIHTLEDITPLPGVSVSVGLTLAARNIAGDIGPRGLVTHRASDNSTAAERVARYGVWDKSVREAISLGNCDPNSIVMQLAVDDGIASRCHRKSLLTAEMEHIGVAVCPHQAFGVVAVIVLAASFIEHPLSSQAVAYDTHANKHELLDKCAHCFAFVEHRRCVFGINGQRFHKHCFLCKVCKSSLQRTYLQFEGDAYCPECLLFRKPQRCVQCDEKLGCCPEYRGQKDGLLCEKCYQAASALLPFNITI